ncbi:MAG TPA: hypothetical protein PLC98_00840 [Anaerolineales bacterium]|nr:hypothetical protein [Anaerolineales bacterium]
MKLQLTSLILGLSLILAPVQPAFAGSCTGSNCVFLPSVMNPRPTATGASYHQGVAIQWDTDNPVRAAGSHADKNLGLRGLVDVTDNNLGYSYYKGLLNYGQDDNKAPQLPYLFNPARGASGLRYYRTRDWNWAASPATGSAGGVIQRVQYPITGLGLATTPGELIYAPRTLTDNPIASGYHMLVMYADESNITLKYTAEDSASTGYTLHIRGIQVDSNLLALYRSLDGGNRYVYTGRGARTYNLPYISAGQPIGFAQGSSIQVAIADTGTFLDPRSCMEFWVGYTGNCPARNGNDIR